MVLELHESVSVLEDDLPDPAVTLEELLHVALAAAVRDVADEDAAAGHGGGGKSVDLFEKWGLETRRWVRNFSSTPNLD